MTSTPDEAVDLTDVEHWFVQRGVPHFVETKTDGSILDTWTRALPLLVVGYLLRGFNALNLAEWSALRNLGVSVAVLAMLLAAWVLSNRLRGVASFARPTDIDAPELALFLIGPAIPILAFEQLGDAIESFVLGIVLLALIYVWSSYGLGPLARWGLRRGRSQLTGLGSLVARALPLLLLFNTRCTHRILRDLRLLRGHRSHRRGSYSPPTTRIATSSPTTSDRRFVRRWQCAAPTVLHEGHTRKARCSQPLQATLELPPTPTPDRALNDEPHQHPEPRCARHRQQSGDA